MDWVLTGDLKGLLETVRGCPSRPKPRPRAFSDEEFREAVAKLDPKSLQFVTSYMRALIDGGGAA
jgi:hypothetical protein